jgi:hypothetical protein
MIGHPDYDRKLSVQVQPSLFVILVFVVLIIPGLEKLQITRKTAIFSQN